MRHGYPLFYCVSEETQAKLLGFMTDPDCLPPEQWSEWVTPEARAGLKYQADYDREMKRAPSRSRGRE